MLNSSPPPSKTTHTRQRSCSGCQGEENGRLKNLSSAGWLILPGDLPLVRGESLRAVADALGQHAVVTVSYQGVRGHPVGFSAACRDQLLALKGNQGAAIVVRAQSAINSVAVLALEDVGVVTDIDTLDDLARAEELLAAR